MKKLNLNKEIVAKLVDTTKDTSEAAKKTKCRC